MEYEFDKIPFDKITKFGIKTLLYTDLFTVSWILGRYCNYSCSYCWDYAHSSVKDFRPYAVIKNTIDSIKSQARANGYNSFHFSFSGGEPTLHPEFLEIVKYYSDDTVNCNNQSMHITSNISQGMKWFEKFVENSQQLNRVAITASWHREHGIKKDNLQTHKKQFAEKLVLLQQNNIQSTINIVMVPQVFDVLWDEANYFASQGLNVTLKPQSNQTATGIVHGYTSDQLKKMHNSFVQHDHSNKSLVERPKSKWHLIPEYREKLKNHSGAIMSVELEDDSGTKWHIDQAERLNAFDFNKFTNWKCQSGVRSIVIKEPSGDIKRGHSCYDKPLGNIQTGFSLFTQSQPCITPSCICSTDIKIPKEKNE